MEFAKFIDNKGWGYSFQSSSNIDMCILGGFLSSDVSWHGIKSYKDWVMHPEADYTSGNITQLEVKKDGFIYMSSCFPLEEDEELVEFKLTKKQFIKILDDWEQICILKPAIVTFKYENDEFIFETK